MIDEIAARELVKRTTEAAGGILLRLFTEELMRLGVPAETINAAADAAHERILEVLRRQRAADDPEQCGPLVLPDLKK